MDDRGRLARDVEESARRKYFRAALLSASAARRQLSGPGGGGIIGSNLAAKSPADGYTMLLGGITIFGVAPSLRKDLPFDPVKDFTPVTMTTRQPILLMMHPPLPAKSVKEFIALAKARP